jgi:hypothetical protein
MPTSDDELTPRRTGEPETTVVATQMRFEDARQDLAASILTPPDVVEISEAELGDAATRLTKELIRKG